VKIDLLARPGQFDFAGLGQFPQLRQRIPPERGVETVQLPFELFGLMTHRIAKFRLFTITTIVEFSLRRDISADVKIHHVAGMLQVVRPFEIKIGLGNCRTPIPRPRAGQTVPMPGAAQGSAQCGRVRSGSVAEFNTPAPAPPRVAQV
jgi:hypothetical protein